MAKISVVVLAGTEAHSDLARVLNALALTKEAKEAGDEVELVFDGAGVSWIPELDNAEHKLHGSEFEGHPSLRSRVADGYEIVTF